MENSHILMQKLINIQYHRGRAARQERWVFGMCDTSVEPALGYMELVPDRTASTLLPIIQAHVRPGTDIQSDQWRAYNSVAQQTKHTQPVSYTHLTLPTNREV